jgi:hypothetical protein
MQYSKRIFVSFSIICILSLFTIGFRYKPVNKPLEAPDLCNLYGAVFIETSASFADYKVYVENVEGFADLLVFREPNQTFANKNGLWHITDARGFADFTIFLEQNRGFADFTICYTPNRGFAGCRK